MTALTMDDLRVMPPGAPIIVTTVGGSNTTRREWVREGDGWRCGTAFLQDDMLTGLANAGLILDPTRMGPEVGDWWRYRYYDLLIVSITDNQARCVALYRGDDVVEIRQIPVDRFLTSRYTRHAEIPAEQLTPGKIRCLAQAYGVAEAAANTYATTANEEKEKVRMLKNRPDPAPLRAEMRTAMTALTALQNLLGAD